MAGRSAGTVTFLFTDIEGSTALLRRLHAEYGDVLAEHQRLLKAAFEHESGEVIDTQGDAFLVAFPAATNAVRAAVEAQQALARHAWPDGAEVRVRIGVDTGEARLAEQRYVGLSVHRGARIAAAGHGGQILISQTTHALLDAEDAALAGLTFRDLGMHRLKDFERPIRLYQVLAPGLRHAFSPVRTAGPARGRRRKIAILATALALAAISAGLAAVLVAGGDSAGVQVRPNSLVKIDPGTNRVASVIEVGRSPGAVVNAAGSLWVVNESDRTISRVDLDTGEVTTVPAGLDNPCCLAADGAGDGVWVSGYATRAITHLDALTGQVDRVIRLEDVAHGSGSLAHHPRLHRLSAAGGGSLWLVDPYAERVRRVGIRSGKMRLDRHVGSLPFAVAFGGGSAWISAYGDDSVVEIRASDEVSREITVPGGPAGSATDARSVWVIAWSDGKVRRLDIASGETTDIVATGQGPAFDLLVDVAVAFGAAWATSGEDTLFRIDSANPSDVLRIELRHRAGMLAVGAGAVWVTVQEPTA